jgi:hypothetical protein
LALSLQNSGNSGENFIYQTANTDLVYLHG